MLAATELRQAARCFEFIAGVSSDRPELHRLPMLAATELRQAARCFEFTAGASRIDRAVFRIGIRLPPGQPSFMAVVYPGGPT